MYRTPRIAIIDDSHGDRVLIRERLLDTFARAGEALDVVDLPDRLDEAVDALAALEGPTVVLLDLHVDGHVGIEAHERLARAWDGPVVAVSGHRDAVAALREAGHMAVDKHDLGALPITIMTASARHRASAPAGMHP